MKPKLITGLVGLLLMSGLWFWLGWDRHPKEELAAVGDGLTAVVDRGDLEMVVEATGSVLTRENFKVVAQMKSRSIIQYAVKQGTRVKAGDSLLDLVTDSIDALILKAEEDYADDELTISDKQTQLEIQQIENQNNLETAENNLEATRLNLEKFIKAEEPQRIREAELLLRTAESEVTRSKKKLEDLTKLLAKQFVTESEVEEQAIAHEKAVVDRDGAKLTLAALHKYELPVQQRDLTNKVDQATVNLRKVEVQNHTKLRLAERSLQKAKDDFTRQDERLEDLREQRGFYHYKSPVDGLVYYGDTDLSSRYRIKTLEVGEDVSPGQVLMTIPINSGMKAEVQVTEADIKKVQVGQKVRVRVDAAEEQMFLGSVSEVAEVATDQGYYTTGVKEFQVKIDMDDPTGLKQGFSCRAEIILGKVESPLRLPVQAVFKEGDDYVVFLPDGSPQVVELGATSITHVEILSGVAEGQDVLLARPGN